MELGNWLCIVSTFIFVKEMSFGFQLDILWLKRYIIIISDILGWFKIFSN